MPKIQGTNRTVQTNTARLTPPSTAGYGSTGRATQQLGKAVAQAGNAIASSFGAVQEKRDDANDRMTILETSIAADKALDDHNRNYTGSGKGFRDEAEKISDGVWQQSYEKLSPKGQQKAREFQLRKKRSVIGTASRRQDSHSQAYIAQRLPKFYGSVLEGSVTTEALKEHGLQPALSAITIGKKYIDDAGLPPNVKTKLYGDLIKATVGDVVQKIDPGQYKKDAAAYDASTKAGKSIIGYSRGNLDTFKVANRSDGKKVDVAELKPALRNGLAQLQQRIGKQLTINSGYRDPKHNAKVGGAKGSRHMHRDAVDLQWPKNATIQEKQQIIAHAKELNFKGFGIGNGILHLDMGRGRFWGYKNGKPTGNIPGWAVDALSGKVKASNAKGATSQSGGIQGKVAEAAQKAGLDPEYMVRLAGAESSFRPGVKADKSSATGLFQITGDTAKRLGTSHGKKSVDQEIADGIAITKANQKTMTNYLGRAPRNDELHLAHVFGAGRANGILSAKNETPIHKVLPPEVIQANASGIFKKVSTVGQLKAWAKAKQNTKVDVASYTQRSTGTGDAFTDELFSKKNRKIVEDRWKAGIKEQVKTSMVGKPSIVLESNIDALHDLAEKDPNNEGLKIALKEAETFKKNQEKSLRNDPLKYADDQGKVEVPSIIGQQDPVKAISERIKQGDEVAQLYQIEPKYLREEEKALLSKQFHEMEAKDKLGFLAGIDKGAGAKAKNILSEMSDIDPSLAHVGGLYLVGRKEAALLAMQGMEVMKDKGLKDITERLKAADINLAFDNYLGNTFGLNGIKAAGPFISTAKSIAIAKMLQDSSLNPAEALEEGMKLATGHKEINGEQYGGVIEFNDQKLMVHPDHRAADYEKLFDYLTTGEAAGIDPLSLGKTLLQAHGVMAPDAPEDGRQNFFLKKDGVNPTNPTTQRPVTAEELNDAQFVSVGAGRVIILVDGVPLLDTRKANNLGDGKNEFATGSEYILDLGRELDESLKLISG